MTEEEAPHTRVISLGRLEWGVIIALALSTGSAIFSIGVTYGDLRALERRTTVIENRTDDVGERLARIESSLDFLVAQYKTDRALEKPDVRN